MRIIAKIAALAVSSTMFVAGASALTIGSGITPTAYTGYSATSPTGPFVGTGPSYLVDPNGVWTTPPNASQWISFNPNAGPKGGYVAPNGFYQYSDTFDNTSGMSALTLTVMADDTVSVYLNSFADEVVAQYNGSSFPKCAISQPNCITPLTVTFGGLTAGTNTLYFVVDQAAKASTGLDYYGTTAVTPEPSSLLLLGTGLIGSAGTLFRRFRRS